MGTRVKVQLAHKALLGGEPCFVLDGRRGSLCLDLFDAALLFDGRWHLLARWGTTSRKLAGVFDVHLWGRTAVVVVLRTSKGDSPEDGPRQSLRE